MYPENKHFSPELASLPVPGDLAGFQCIENGKVLEGDLLVTEGRREWARGCVGWDVADLQRMLEIRTYRKMPVPRAGHGPN